MRYDKRNPDQLRPVKFTRRFTNYAPGSVLVEMGETRVLCTAMIHENVPAWLRGAGSGWVTAEYSMLPSSNLYRKVRDSRRGQIDSRSLEIERLVGRSLRAVTNLKLIGERTIYIDCDVIQADGGTRTASITGGFVALVDLVGTMLKDRLITENPMTDYLAAVSVGLVDGEILLDLAYKEDVKAEVDMNVVATRSGKLVEVQGTAEERPFDRAQLDTMLDYALPGIKTLTDYQIEALSDVVFPPNDNKAESVNLRRQTTPPRPRESEKPAEKTKTDNPFANLDKMYDAAKKQKDSNDN